MKKPSEHYVDNQLMFKAIKAYLVLYNKAKRAKRDRPQIPEYLGECFLKIATHLSYKPNFIGYTFREDMISDGVENCLVYIHNFNPEKSSNPFGYFTQIIYYAFLRRLKREQKHTYIKYKLLEKQIIDGDMSDNPDGAGPLPADTTMLNFDNVQDFIKRFDEYSHKRRERRRSGKRKTEPVVEDMWSHMRTPDEMGVHGEDDDEILAESGVC